MSYSKLPFFSEEISEFVLKRVDQFDPITYSSCITVSKSWSSFFINLKHDTFLGCHIVRISNNESLDDVIKCNNLYILKNNEILFSSPLKKELIKLEFKSKDSCFAFDEFKESFKFNEYQLLTTKNLNLIKAWTGHTPYVDQTLLYIDLIINNPFFIKQPLNNLKLYLDRASSAATSAEQKSLFFALRPLETVVASKGKRNIDIKELISYQIKIFGIAAFFKSICVKEVFIRAYYKNFEYGISLMPQKFALCLALQTVLQTQKESCALDWVNTLLSLSAEKEHQLLQLWGLPETRFFEFSDNKLFICDPEGKQSIDDLLLILKEHDEESWLDECESECQKILNMCSLNPNLNTSIGNSTSFLL